MSRDQDDQTIQTSESNQIDSYRRKLLAGAAALGTITLVPGVSLMITGGTVEAHPSDDAAASSRKRWGILIDVNRCPENCNVCIDACQTENGWSARESSRTDAQWVRKVTVNDKKTGTTTTLPMMCQHCASPPCVDVCPTGASFKRADGIVLVDKHRCIGCRYCMVACPYNARSFVHEDLTNQKAHAPRGKGTVESCTLCVHKIDANEQPACVTACRLNGSNTMIFGDLNNPESDISKAVNKYLASRIRNDLNLGTGILYQGLRG